MVRHRMTCGTHTTAKSLGGLHVWLWSLSLSLSLVRKLSKNGMTAVNVPNSAFLEEKKKVSPVVFSRSGQRHRLSFSLLFFSLHFFFFFASWPGCCACTLDTRVLVSLCALLKRMWKLVALFCHLHPSTSFSKRKDLCQHAQRPACVCVWVDVCARVCVYACAFVYIYIKKRE